MDRLRRWRPRKPADRAGARRAGATAVAVFAVTAGLTVLLAVLFHLAWPPVLIALVGTVPALYLAWLAVPNTGSPTEPAAASRPTFGRPVGQWDPVELGVHKVIGGGPMPAYVRRRHDEVLRKVLDPAVAASRLVVVRGGSSTGKSRAACEAVADRLAGWRLDYPLDPDALAERLEAGIPARTVLWLGELRQYANADGGPAVLARLADLLQGEGCMLITTVWPEQWNAYTDAARAGTETADPAGSVGRLLAGLPELTDPDRVDPARGGVIDIPDTFTLAEINAAARTGDPVLAAAIRAAASAGDTGQLAQYLAGVPDLLNRYEGPGGKRYGQAVITAAMDAARLGFQSVLPGALLLDAAPGYVTPADRTKPVSSWGKAALAWAAKELRGAVRALYPVPPAHGTGTLGYRPADYLDQHGRHTRQDQTGPDSLWDALTVHTGSPGDLTRLGQAARDRGLFRYAAILWTTAAAVGSAAAACRLIDHLDQVSPDDVPRAARWAVARARLDDPRALPALWEALLDAGLNDMISAVGARAAAQVSLDEPATVGNLLMLLHVEGLDDAAAAAAAQAADDVRLDEPAEVAFLVREMSQAEVGDAISLLGARAAAEVSLDDPQDVGELLTALDEAGATDAVAALATRAAAQVSADEPRADARLLKALHEAGAVNAIHTFATRAGAHADLTYAHRVAELLEALRDAGASDAIRALSARASRVTLGDLLNITGLLKALHEAGASDAVSELAARAAAQIRLDSAEAVAGLLNALRDAGASDAIHTLLDRGAARHVPLGAPGGVARLLQELRAAGANDAIHVLLARSPAEHVSLDEQKELVELVLALREAEASEQIGILADRIVGKVSLDKREAVAWLKKVLDETGSIDRLRALMSGADPPWSVDLRDATWVVKVLSEARTGNAIRIVAAEASLHDPSANAGLLRQLHSIGAGNAVRALANRAVEQVGLDNLRAVSWLLSEMMASGADGAVAALAARAAAQVNPEEPESVATLLDAFQAVHAGDALRILLERDPAAHASLSNPHRVAQLLRALDKAGASNAVTILAKRATAITSLRDPQAVTFLLTTLREAKAWNAVSAVADKAASQVDVGDQDAIEGLLKELTQAQAGGAARILTERAASAGMFDLFLEANPALAADYKSGRTPDGAPAQSWTWQTR